MKISELFAWSHDEDVTASLIGRTISRVRMGEEYLVFDTDQGEVIFAVVGDCCSQSYFFDFYGVERLLAGHPVTAFERVDLEPGDPGYHDPDVEVDYAHIECYGYRLSTEDPKWGPVSSVFSFRNASNGYYGGWMERAQSYSGDLVELTTDKVG